MMTAVCQNWNLTHRLLRCVKMREMQGAEDEVEGSILKYVTETEFRKQRSRLRIFTHRLGY